jgi:ABC-type sugar transport system permease subunit
MAEWMASAGTTQLVEPRVRFTHRRREALGGYLFILPWILGLLIFVAYPIIASLYYSFTGAGWIPLYPAMDPWSADLRGLSDHRLPLLQLYELPDRTCAGVGGDR